jgi:hypothetical protein
MVHLQISPLGGSRDETWREHGIRKRSVSWNLPKISKLWRCSGCFGQSTTQNHLRTTQFVSGTRNSSKMAACALRNEQTGRVLRPKLSRVGEKLLLWAQRSQHIVRAENCNCLSQVSGAFCAMCWLSLRMKKLKWNQAFHGCPMLKSGSNRKGRER